MAQTSRVITTSLAIAMAVASGSIASARHPMRGTGMGCLASALKSFSISFALYQSSCHVLVQDAGYQTLVWETFFTSDFAYVVQII
jgi:hypothetical protein